MNCLHATNIRGTTLILAYTSLLELQNRAPCYLLTSLFALLSALYAVLVVTLRESGQTNAGQKWHVHEAESFEILPFFRIMLKGYRQHEAMRSDKHHSKTSMVFLFAMPHGTELSGAGFSPDVFPLS